MSCGRTPSSNSSRLGISWVWMGIEGCNSQYVKLQGIDTFELVRELQSHGIRVLGSTIIGLEEHTPENIDAAIEHAARHDTDFHQFMLYTPIPGTPLHAELDRQRADEGRGRVRPGRHPRAVGLQLSPSAHSRRDGERVHAAGLRSRLQPQRAEHVADRPHDAGRLEALQEPSRTPASAAAMPGRPASWRRPSRPSTAGAKMYYRGNPAMRAKMAALLKESEREFGWKSRLMSAAGRAATCYWKICARSSGWPPAGPTSRPRSTKRTAPATTGPPIPAAMSRRKRPPARQRPMAS